MPKVVIVACYIAIISFAFSSVLHIPKNLKNQINKNETSKMIYFLGSLPIFRSNSSNFIQNDQQLIKINSSESEVNNKTLKVSAPNSKDEHDHQYSNKVFESIPILQKIHSRITRSKDAVWATVTLTFMCVLLVLAVAQSRMWKDHYYIESQGVPLPSFNERVLFKDVMEHKISTLKKFFKKKKSKEKDETELESLLPPSEWDNSVDIL